MILALIATSHAAPFPWQNIPILLVWLAVGAFWGFCLSKIWRRL